MYTESEEGALLQKCYQSMCTIKISLYLIGLEQWPSPLGSPWCNGVSFGEANSNYSTQSGLSMTAWLTALVIKTKHIKIAWNLHKI